MHKYFKCPIVVKLWSHVQNFIWLNFNLLIHSDLNSLLFHQYNHKKPIDNIRTATLICTINYALWKIEKDGSDPNLPNYLIWNKCKVYKNCTLIGSVKLWLEPNMTHNSGMSSNRHWKIGTPELISITSLLPLPFRIWTEAIMLRLILFLTPLKRGIKLK